MPTPATESSSRKGKRSADSSAEDDQDRPRKAPKLFSIFTKPDSSAAQSPFRWVPSLGEKKTCLHGVHLDPTPSSRVAAFDLDGCLIQSSFGNGTKGKSKAPQPVKWWRSVVPTKLKEAYLAGYRLRAFLKIYVLIHTSYSIVIVTNQALRGQNAIIEWKKKIPVLANMIPEVPFHIFAATAKDGYRKPMPGMWYELENIWSLEKVTIDRNSSFFVGDAAGRNEDHAGTDRKLAENINIPFLTPEEYFLKLPPAPYNLQGFNVSSLPELPLFTPATTPLVQPSGSSPEIVLFVGLPASGKTSIFRQHFQPEGYIHVNQDTLKSRDKCLKAVEEAIHQGQSCVVDNTNRDIQTRKLYIELAKRLKVPIRCACFQGSVELSWHNNLYRAFNMPTTSLINQSKRDLLPYSALVTFKTQFEEPSLEEGFKEVKKINWVFHGTDEERERWKMWLQIDGK